MLSFSPSRSLSLDVGNMDARLINVLVEVKSEVTDKSLDMTRLDHSDPLARLESGLRRRAGFSSRPYCWVIVVLFHPRYALEFKSCQSTKKRHCFIFKSIMQQILHILYDKMHRV